jgi:hypothetical protein
LISSEQALQVSLIESEAAQCTEDQFTASRQRLETASRAGASDEIINDVSSIAAGRFADTFCPIRGAVVDRDVGSQ